MLPTNYPNCLKFDSDMSYGIHMHTHLTILVVLSDSKKHSKDVFSSCSRRKGEGGGGRRRRRREERKEEGGGWEEEEEEGRRRTVSQL